MIELTEWEFTAVLEDFSRLDDCEQAAVIDSLSGYFDSDRNAWHISCTPAAAVLMDFVTYILENHM